MGLWGPVLQPAESFPLRLTISERVSKTGT
jgi:hypothetical protein